MEVDEIEEYREQPAELAAEAKGLVIVEPKSNEVFIDVDDEPSLQAFYISAAVVQDYLPFTYEKRVSPSGAEGRFHIYVRLSRDVKNEEERIMLQAILGSDRKREALNLRRVLTGCREHASVFFEKPGSI